MAYLIKTSLGEVLDKLSILEIKLSFAKEELQKTNIKNELSHLQEIATPLWDKGGEKLKTQYAALKNINLKLWDIEDNIRLKEKDQDFGDEFIQLARSVYITNDERARVKKEINTLLDSEFFEEKIYT